MANKSKIDWGKFEPLAEISFTREDFRETLDGGQAFTWYRTDCDSDSAPEYEGVFHSNAARIRLDKSGRLLAAFPKSADAKLAKIALSDYFDCKTDYIEIRQCLEASADRRMIGALKAYPTLRILRQNPNDAIVSFICSSSKRIVQIKQCVALLSQKLGDNIAGDFHSIPSFCKIAKTDESVLRECKLGFRAAYLKKSALKICADEFDPMSLRGIPYADAKKYLTSLSGIGEKVADCILLFGASRFEAFPVDTWIRKAMDSMYSTGENSDAIRAFAAKRFGSRAGFAQQLMFAAIRNGAV